MFRKAYIAALAGLLISCAHGQEMGNTSAEIVRSAPEYNGSYIRRPTLLVSDIETSLSLYRDILGFRLGSLKQDGVDSYAYEAFNIPAGTDVDTPHWTVMMRSERSH